MSDSPVYEAMRAYIRAAVELEVSKSATEIRSALPATQVIEGPAGKDGTDGVDGKDGTTGERGANGKDGTNGINGKDGIEGINGINGVDGLDGKDGAPGERGADGIATREELDALVEQRFGELQVRTFADIYRGVYSPSETYTRGQLATWGGSVYLAKADTTSKPGESVDWQMIVKRGADARR